MDKAKTATARERALEFAKKVPKPRQAARAPPVPTSAAPTSGGRGRRGGRGGRGGQGGQGPPFQARGPGDGDLEGGHEGGGGGGAEDYDEARISPGRPGGPRSGGIAEMSALDELELKHDQARGDVEAIRREFGL